MQKSLILEKNKIIFVIASLNDLNVINKIEKELKFNLTTLKQFNFLFDNQVSYLWKILYKNEIIGFIQLKGDKIESEILSIGVKKNFQGLGVGKKTIKFLIKKGFKNIFLEVSEKNTKAINFYYSVGFKKIEIRKKYYKINRIKPENAQILNLTII